MANPQKIKAVVSEIIDYGNQVYKVVMNTEKKMPRFKAGQFLHLTLEAFDPTAGFWPESRVFSIASCSDDRKEVSIVYSVKGVYTHRMENTLQEGMEVWLKAPYGEFIIPNHIESGETAVLIAGGTGVSPFIPFLKTSSDQIDIKLNYGLRHIDLMIFEKELKEALRNDQFKVNLYLEQKSNTIPINGKVDVKNGMLSINEILKDDINLNNTKFFISGPPAMIELFKKQLIESSVQEEKIIIDEWG